MRDISSHVKSIEGQPMFKVIDKVKLLKTQGSEIIHLEIDDPDFKTPQNIIDPAKTSLDKGEMHYVSS